MKPVTLIVKLNDLLLDPEHPGAAADLPPDVILEKLKRAYGFLSANTDFTIQDDSVVITFDPALDEDVRRVQGAFDRALKQVVAGRLNKAVDLFQRVLKSVPSHAEARRNLAMALMESRRFTEAKDELVDILRLEPSNSWALMLMGNIFAKHESNFPVAETYYTKAHALSPQDAYILTNYAALRTEQGRAAEAQTLFEQAIAADPSAPNPYYGLATLFSAADRHKDAWQTLERMFYHAAFTDPRSQKLLEESRRLYLSLCAQVADLQAEQALKWVVGFSAHVAKEIGTPIEILADDSLGSTSSRACYDWDRQGTGHCVRYNPSAPSIVPALILREVERIRLKQQDREDRIPEPVYIPTGRSFDDSLLEFVLLVPEQARIANGLQDASEDIQPALFIEAYLRTDEQYRAYESMKTQRGASAACIEAFELAASSTAYHMDSLFEPRTAYGDRYAKIRNAARARELAEEWMQIEENYAGQRDHFIQETVLGEQINFGKELN